MGMLHPESIYDDPKCQPLRKEVFLRLRYHFQYANEMTLFSEVDHHTKYGEQIYGGRQESVNFISINNLFHPSTIDGCLIHDGHGLCGGIKTIDGRWNTEAHKDRIVHFGEEELKVLSLAFEDGGDWSCTKLVSIHASSILHVLSAFANFKGNVGDISPEPIITVAFDETGCLRKGYTKRDVCATSGNELIYVGPHVFVCNPVYKTPRRNCVLNSDYDPIDLTTISDTYQPRTCYIPLLPIDQYDELQRGFVIGQNVDGSNIYDSWLHYYKAGFRRMMGATSERSLSGAILPANYLHIGSIKSIVFKEYDNLVEFVGLSSSIVLDFKIKIMNVTDLHKDRIMPLPLGIDVKYKPSLFARTLILNCLTTAYSDLWEDMWDAAYKQETWSKDDIRLKPFSMLTNKWQWATPLRNYYERRQALVEIDVIAAMALGLSLQDLEMIYTIQFPVLQQNENDTWYDAGGKIVFTCSKGLTGVGLDRKRNTSTGMLGWEDIRGEQIDENTYAGTSPTHTHTIDPAKSELYGGQQQTFVAPYIRCDRIADYRTAWAHFEKIFGDK
jgi:hypothetical protein